MENFFNKLQEKFLIIDYSGKILFCNKILLNQLQYQLDELDNIYNLIINPQINFDNINNNYNDNKYFISKASEYIFYLVELDGKERMEKLKVTRKHYSNKKVAKEWRDNIAKEIHPDVCKIKDAEKAIAKLNQLYSGMISNEK